MRGIDGEITVPAPRTNQDIKDGIKLKVANGEYVLGELIVPRKYKKFVLNKKEKSNKCFIISGRKIHLIEIRPQLLKIHQKLGLMRDYNNSHYENLTEEEIKVRLQELGELDTNKENNSDLLRKKLMDLELKCLCRHFFYFFITKYIFLEEQF